MNPDGTGFFNPAGNKFSGINLHGGSMTGDTISVSQVYGGTAILKLQPCAGISITIEDAAGVQSVITSPSTYTSSPIVAGSYGGDSTPTFKLISISGPNTVNGCTDSNATNYNNLATDDDGTCQFTCDKSHSNTNADGSCASGCITGYEEDDNGDCFVIESSGNGNGNGNGNGSINTLSNSTNTTVKETNWMPFMIGGIALIGGFVVLSKKK